MTRINLGIEPQELCDQHLIAEYRELPRLWKYLHGVPKKIQGDFRLGTGHVLWCAQYLGTMADRFDGLVAEMTHRGFRAQHKHAPVRAYLGARVPESQLVLARGVLQERIRSKFKTMRGPRFTRRDPPDWL